MFAYIYQQRSFIDKGTRGQRHGCTQEFSFCGGRSGRLRTDVLHRSVVVERADDVVWI